MKRGALTDGFNLIMEMRRGGDEPKNAGSKIMGAFRRVFCLKLVHWQADTKTITSCTHMHAH